MTIKTYLIKGGAVRRSISFSEAILKKLQEEASIRCEGNISMLIRGILIERYRMRDEKN